MRRTLKRIAIGLTLSSFATVALAQNYNSIVIEVPYEISVPASYTIAKLDCTISGSDRRYANYTELVYHVSEIPLENGQARGVLKFGLDSTGATQDLIPFEERNILFEANYPGFGIQSNCRTTHFLDGSGATYKIVERNGWTVLGAHQGPLVFLEDGHKFIVKHTHDDNVYGQSGAGPTATTQVPTASNGLQGLQSILEGD